MIDSAVLYALGMKLIFVGVVEIAVALVYVSIDKKSKVKGGVPYLLILFRYFLIQTRDHSKSS